MSTLTMTPVSLQWRVQTFSLTDFLKALGPLPEPTIALGMCDDGLPLLLDLANPAPGSLLITGDSGCGKTGLLRAIVDSAAILNPQAVQSVIITPNPEEWGEKDTLAPYKKEAGEAVVELASLANARRSRNDRMGRLNDGNRQPGNSRAVYCQAIILALDSLDNFLDYNRDLAGHLFWLVKEGPKSQVWPILIQGSGAHLTTTLDYFLMVFSGGQVGTVIAGRASATPTDNFPPGCFAVQMGEWVRFFAPISEVDDEQYSDHK